MQQRSQNQPTAIINEPVESSAAQATCPSQSLRPSTEVVYGASTPTTGAQSYTPGLAHTRDQHQTS